VLHDYIRKEENIEEEKYVYVLSFIYPVL